MKSYHVTPQLGLQGPPAGEIHLCGGQQGGPKASKTSPSEEIELASEHRLI